MAKWYGKIGYVKTVENVPGVYKEEVVEREYMGELLQVSRSLQNNNSTNDNINISNQLSIVADPYANENFFAMRYAEFMGTKWKVTNVSVSYPRLTLTLGGVYNGA